MTISDTEVFKRAEIPPKDLSDEGKCLLAAQEEANATQTYLNMADNTDDEALKANFEEVAGDEMEHLGKNLMSAAHIRPELAEHMINGAQEAESEGFDIDQAIKDRFAKEDAKKAESTDFDEAIQEHVKRSYPSEEAKIDEILYEMFSKAKANGATYISDQFLGWLKDTESFKKAYEREQIGEYDIDSPGMQRFRSKIDRDKKYVDKLDKKFNLEEMYDDLQMMYSVKELEQAEKELLDLKKKMLAEPKGMSDKDMRDHYNNLLNKYNEIQKMRAYNEYIDVRAQIKRMEMLLEHVDDLSIPEMQRFRDKIDRDKKYIDMLDKEFNLKEMHDDLQRMYTVKELEQAEKELRDLNNKIFAESRGISDKDMRDHYNNLTNKYNEIQKMRAYNEYIDLRAQIERMEKLLKHADDLSIPGMQGFRDKIDRDKKYVDKLDKKFNLKKMYDSPQKMYSVKELEQAEKELLDLKKKMLAESRGISDKDMRDHYNNLLNKYNEIQKMRAYNEYIDVRAQIKRMEKLLEHVDDLSIPGIMQRIRDKIDRDKKYVDKLDKEFNLKEMYDSSQKMYSVNELEQAKKELRNLNKDVMEISGYNKLANKYNEIQKMRAYNKYIGVGAQTERMEKLLELINDFVEKINEAFGDKIDERLANTEGENVYETKWGRDDPEKVIEDYNSVVEEAFKDPDVKEIMDKIGALGFNPRQIITEVLGGSEDMDAKDLLRSRLGSSPESVGKMLSDITESHASGIGQSPKESRKIQEIASRNKGDVYFPESKNKNIYGGVNYNRLGVKSDPRLDALATIMAEVENNYKTRKYGGKTTPIDRETFTPGQKHRQMAFDLMSILGYLFDENDPIRIFDRSKGSKYDLSNLDLLTNKDDTYQKIANEIESAMKGAKKDRLWALMKDPVQPSSLDSIQKWSVGDGMNLGMGWVRDAIYKFAEDVANGNIDLPIPKNKPEGETDERYESAKKAVDELKAGKPMTYGRMQDILGYEATGDAFVNSLNDSNMFGTALNVIRPQLYDEVEKFIGSDGTKRDLLVEKSLPDSNVRDRYLAIMDAIRRKVASKNHLKSFPSLRDVLDAVYEITTNDIKRQRIPSNISDFRKVITLKDKFKDIVDALTAYSSFENISGLKSIYDELEDGVNSLGYESQKNKKNTKQLRDILDIISKPNFTLSDLSEDQMNYLKTHDIIGSDEGETAEDFKKNLIRKVKNAIANSNATYLLEENNIKQPMDILYILSKPNFTLSDLSEDQMNYLKTHDIIGSDEGEHTNSDTTIAEDFKKNLIRKVKNAIANSNARYLEENSIRQPRDILDIISKPNFTLSDLSEDQMNYLKTHDIIGSDEGEHTNSDTTTAKDFKKNLIRKVKNAIAKLANSNTKPLIDILDIMSKPYFILSDLSEDQMNYLKTHDIIGSDEGETAEDFKKNPIRMVKNAIAKLANSDTKQLMGILDIISKPNFTLSDLSEDQMNYLKTHDIIGSDEGEHTNSDTTIAEDFKKNLIRKVKNAIANSNAEYLLKENKSNLEYVLRTALGSKGAKLFTELIKIANDKNYLDALDEFERTGSTKKYGWDKSIQVPLGSRDGKTISVPLYEVLNSGLMQNFDKIYDTVMAAVGPVDKNNPVYEGDNSMLMNILQRNKLRRDDKKYVNESNKDRFGYIPHPGYEGKNLDKGEIFALYNDPEKRDEFPLSKKLKAEEYLPSYLRLKGSDLSMSDEFLSSLVFRNRKFSPEEIARITTSDFNTRHIRDIADALSKGQELNETDKALVKLFGIGDMGFESLSNLVKNIDSNTFKKYEESIKKNGYKSVIEDLENKSKTDKSVVEDLELLKATYELISKARNIDDDVRAIYEESVDDFEKRLNEAGESIYEILGSEGAYDKLVQMGEKLYTDFQKEVDYSEDLKKRKTEGDKIKFLERAGVPIGYKDRTGDIKYFKQGDATQADLQRYFNEMYKNYLDDEKNTGLRDRLNEYYLYEDQDDFVPIKGWSDSSMRLTKKHPLRNISVANALTSAMGWEDLDPTKLVMSNKWLKDVDPDRDEISIVKDILDGYVDYFTGDVESEPKSLLNSLWSMGDNTPSEIEALDANGRAIEEMNGSNKKDDTDQEGEDERYGSLEDLIASNLQARINNARGERAAKEKQDKINKILRKEEEVEKIQQKNKKTINEIKKKKRELDETEEGIKFVIGEKEWGKMGEGEKIKKIRDEWNKRQEEKIKKIRDEWNKRQEEEMKKIKDEWKKRQEKEMKKNKAKAEKVKEKKKFYGEDEPAEIDLSTPEVTPTSNNTSSDGGEKVKKEKDSGDAVESTKKSAAKIMNVKGAKTRILDPNLDSEGIHTGKVFPSWQKDSYVISMCDPNVENIPPKPPEISNAQPEGATMKTWDIDEAIKERQK